MFDMRLVAHPHPERDLLTVYRRSDDRIEADVAAAIQARTPQARPGTPAPVTVHVGRGVESHSRTLRLPQQGRTRPDTPASRVAGVVAVPQCSLSSTGLTTS